MQRVYAIVQAEDEGVSREAVEGDLGATGFHRKDSLGGHSEPVRQRDGVARFARRVGLGEFAFKELVGGVPAPGVDRMAPAERRRPATEWARNVTT
jgi:hypothetical protein